jgi:hypothetical protein
VRLPAGLSAAARGSTAAAVASAPAAAGRTAASAAAGTTTYTLSSSVYTFITSTLGIPIGTSPTVSGTLSGQTLTLTVGSPGPLPLTMPAGISAPVFGNTTVVIDESAGTITLNASATTGVTATLRVTIANAATSTLAGGTDVSSSLTISNVPFLGGSSASLTGSLGYNGSTLSASLTGTLATAATLASGALTVQPGTSLTLATGTGLTINGTATIGTGTYALATTLTGALTDLSNWSLTVSASGSQLWQPVSSLQLMPNFSTVVTDSKGVVSYDFTLSGVNGVNPVTWTPGANASVSLSYLEIANTTPGAGVSCASAITAGDLWIDAKGGFTYTPASSAAVNAEACIDVTGQSFSLGSTAPAGLTALSGNSLFAVTAAALTATGDLKKKTFTVTGTATIQVTGVSSQPRFSAAVSFGTSGVIAAVTVPDLSTLSSYLSGAGTLYVSSFAVSGFDPASIGLSGAPFNLPQGLAVTLSYQVPQSVTNLLSQIGIGQNVLAGASADATATLGTSGFTIGLSLNLGTGTGGAQVVSDGGIRFYLDNIGVTFAAGGASGVSVSVNGGGWLVLPAVLPSGSTSQVGITATGSFSVSGTGYAASVGLTFGAWQGGAAFGVPGLGVQAMGAQLGIADDIPTLGFTAQGITLPASVGQAIGLSSTAVIGFTGNFSPASPILGLSVTSTGGGAALTPLSIASSDPNVIGSLIVNNASVYLAPTGGTIGTIQFDPGFSVIFDATIDGVNAHIDAAVDPAALSVTANASLSTFWIGPVQVTNPKLAFSLRPANLGLTVSGGITTNNLQLSAAISLAAGSTENGASISLSITGGVPASLAGYNVAAVSGSLSGYVYGTASAASGNNAVSFSVSGSGYLYAGGASLGPASFSLSVPGSFNWSDFTNSATQVASFFLYNAGVGVSQVMTLMENLGYSFYDILNSLGDLGDYGSSVASSVASFFGFSTTYYDIWNYTSSGQYLVWDVSGGSQSPNAGVITYPWNNGYNQDWQFVQSPYSGWYEIVNRGSGQCLSVSGPSQNPGTGLVQYPCFGGYNQLWYMGYIALGTDYAISTAYSPGQVVDIQNAYQWPGGTLDQYPYNGNWNQWFYLTNSAN